MNVFGGPILTSILTCLLLSAALALSLRRFIMPYTALDHGAEVTSPVTMVATAVFLAAFALTLSDTDLIPAGLTMIAGLLLAKIFDDAKPALTVALSAACLFAYLGLR
jgi:hypothetical protein